MHLAAERCTNLKNHDLFTKKTFLKKHEKTTNLDLHKSTKNTSFDRCGSAMGDLGPPKPLNYLSEPTWALSGSTFGVTGTTFLPFEGQIFNKNEPWAIVFRVVVTLCR